MTCAAGYAASSALISQDVLPLAVGYALLMGALAVGLLMLRRSGHAAVRGQEPSAVRSAPRPVMPDRYGWLRLTRHLAATFVGGYLLLMAVVIGYYFGIARVTGNFIEGAFTGCALLIGLSSPVFAVASWLLERWRTRIAAGSRPSRGDHR